MNRFRIFTSVALFLIMAAASLAAVPQQINYQGLLTNVGGTPVADGSYSVVFTIYTAPTGGIALWTETKSVTTSSGLFSTLLGSVTPIPDSVFATASTYLGVKVGADPEISPRTELASVPYANRVGTVDGATGGTFNGNLDVVDSDTTSKMTEGAMHPGALASITGRRMHLRSGVFIFPNTTTIDLDGVSGRIGIGTQTPNEQLEITKNFRLPATTATTGIIMSGASRFIHNFGANNTFIGLNAGNLTMSGVNNTASGFNSLKNITTGSQNTASGVNALVANTTGVDNTASGNAVLFNNTSGDSNTAVGDAALFSNSNGSRNTASGESALRSNTTGSNNTAIGSGADVTLGALTNATAIGANAKVSASNCLVLGNGVNVGIGTSSPTAKLHVCGDIEATVSVKAPVAFITGAVACPSDARLKKNVMQVDGALDLVAHLRGVRYDWDREHFPDRHFSDARQIGFIAQELKEVVPELVTKMSDGYYAVDYSRLAPVLVEAIKELKLKTDRIEELEQKVSEIDQLKSQLAVMSDQLTKLLAAQSKSAGDTKLAVSDKSNRTAGK